MRLKEFESKQLFNLSNIPTSNGVLIKSIGNISEFDLKRIAKVQTMCSSRGKNGGIKIVNNSSEAKSFCQKFLNNQFQDEIINEILLDDLIEIKKEFYLGIIFNTSKKCPVLIFSTEGGIDIEQVKKESPEKVILQEINYIKGITNQQIDTILNQIKNQTDNINQQLKEIITKLYDCFTKFDCKMLEINPLVITNDNKLIAIDAVVTLDDNANFRREIKFSERTGIRAPTKRELMAKKIDEEDHRGVAGKTFLDLDGDIGILASGGGASITLMDALENFGGKAANYTEYSGNPPAEKVEKLTEIVLNKPNLSGLLIAGVIANFTDIAETIKGILNTLKRIRPDFPIVIRRAGPNDQEAKRILNQAKEEYKLDIHYFDETTPLTESAKIMVELSNKYKLNKNN